MMRTIMEAHIVILELRVSWVKNLNSFDHTFEGRQHAIHILLCGVVKSCAY
jgi:hypothetical protein